MRRHAWLLLIAACSGAADPIDKPVPVVAAAAPADPPKEDREDPPVASTALTVEVVIAGATTTWHEEEFARVHQVAGKASSGEARETWSLRELAHTIVGPNARVVAVTGSDGKKVIDAAHWQAADQTPILHTTRRGTLKFRYADKTGEWGPTEVRDVIRLELVQ